MGTPKGDLLIGDSTLLERAVDTMQTALPGRPVAVVAGQLATAPAGARVLADLPVGERDIRAPIIGLRTALYSAETDWITVLAVDLPFATAELIRFLLDFLDDEMDAVVPTQPDEMPQPLCALYRCDVLRHVEDAIGRRDLSLRSLLERLKVRYVAASEYSHLDGAQHFFFNINTPADIDRALSLRS